MLILDTLHCYSEFFKNNHELLSFSITFSRAENAMNPSELNLLSTLMVYFARRDDDDDTKSLTKSDVGAICNCAGDFKPYTE